MVVVGNGAPVPEVPEGVRTIELPENLGIPGGRNVGIEAFGPGGTDLDILLFLDDDGLLAHTDTAELCRAAFEADPSSASSASASPTRTPASPSAATSRACAPRTRCAPPA
ncbi:glycosyl transferase [Streptomyces alboflavus]|uniref:Glycosyl transferase n=1 Tax=Streptomyces alboflavus TaxID=67267 RepID=A0A1Z1WN55_9ACTN|nr:glycosyl transferase [Streptomyces alboflavus]